jgi:hypothetical protein
MYNNDPIAILNDTQIGIHNSSMLYAKNQELFWDNVFFPYCLENGIKEIYHLGDYFDNRKKIDAKILSAHKISFLDKLTNYKISMKVLLGNHDIYYNHTNELSLTREILCHYSNIELIETPITVIPGLVDLIPWVNDENREITIKFINESKSKILFGHFDLAGFEMDGGIVRQIGLFDRNLLKKYEMVYSGHFHKKQKQGNIMYLGAQTQFTWGDCGTDKFFHVFYPNTNSSELIAIHNPYDMYAKIVYPFSQKEIDAIKKGLIDKKFVRLLYKKISDSNQQDFIEFLDYLNTNSGAYSVEVIEDAYYKETTIIDESNNNSIVDSASFELDKLFSKFIDKFHNTDFNNQSDLLAELSLIYNEASSLLNSSKINDNL